jgi:hypothetical protein
MFSNHILQEVHLIYLVTSRGTLGTLYFSSFLVLKCSFNGGSPSIHPKYAFLLSLSSSSRPYEIAQIHPLLIWISFLSWSLQDSSSIIIDTQGSLRRFGVCSTLKISSLMRIGWWERQQVPNNNNSGLCSWILGPFVFDPTLSLSEVTNSFNLRLRWLADFGQHLLFIVLLNFRLDVD